jgi:hypothetical protein
MTLWVKENHWVNRETVQATIEHSAMLEKTFLECQEVKEKKRKEQHTIV